jgi:hypothetical protein
VPIALVPTPLVASHGVLDLPSTISSPFDGPVSAQVCTRSRLPSLGRLNRRAADWATPVLAGWTSMAG